MVPSTPGTAKLNKSAVKRRNPLDTPSISRVKNKEPGSSPDYKSPLRLKNQLESMNVAP